MKITVIPSWFKKKEDEHLGHFFLEQALAVEGKDCHVNMFYPYAAKFGPKGIEMVGGVDVTYCRLATYRMLGSVRSTVKQLSRVELEFKHFIKEQGRPDLIHAHSVYPGGIIAHHLSQKFDIPFLLTEHLSALFKTYNSIRARLKYRWTIKSVDKAIVQAYKNAKTIIAVSSFLKSQIEQKYNVLPRHIQVVPNIVSSRFSFDNGRSRIEKKKVKLVMVGGLSEIKNIPLAVDSVKFLRDNYDFDATLDVIGDGPLRNSLKEYIANKGLSNYVKLLGRQSAEELNLAYNSSHILLSTSKLETFGVVLIEALSTGLPVVATNSGGPKDIIEGGAGVLVKNHNVADFTEGILAVLKNYHNLDFSTIAKTYQLKYSANHIGQQLNQIYKTCLK